MTKHAPDAGGVTGSRVAALTAASGGSGGIAHGTSRELEDLAGVLWSIPLEADTPIAMNPFW
jgi:hypothetical protein